MRGRLGITGRPSIGTGPAGAASPLPIRISGAGSPVSQPRPPATSGRWDILLAVIKSGRGSIGTRYRNISISIAGLKPMVSGCNALPRHNEDHRLVVFLFLQFSAPLTCLAGDTSYFIILPARSNASTMTFASVRTAVSNSHELSFIRAAPHCPRVWSSPGTLPRREKPKQDST